MIGRLLETAAEVARLAGEIQRRARAEGFEVAAKGDADVVTAVDGACERAIVDALRGRFPDHGIVAEEGTTLDPEAGYVWIIDPLDGTKNFAHGSPRCGVSVAVSHRGEVVAGAVYAPFTDELFTAAAGLGARCNDRPIRVSTVGDLRGAMVASALTYAGRDADTAQLARLTRVFREVQALRSLGCAALDLADVARGRLDAYFEPGLKPWDTAAGALLVREAGGAVARFDGGEHHPDAPDLLATNGPLHATLGALMRGGSGA